MDNHFDRAIPSGRGEMQGNYTRVAYQIECKAK
jgi:hypothetical protein